jgi:hypothetical protein
MSMSTTGTTRTAAVILAMATASPALAAPGNGIRLGGNEGRLHPFVEIEDRYDSNAFLAETGGKSVGDMVLHVRPGFELDSPGELATVELSGNLDWTQYLGLESPDTSKELSKVYGQAALGVSVNARGTVGLELDDEFRRNQGTTSLALGEGVVSNANVLRLKVPFRPGGGALLAALTGGWLLETFEGFRDDQVGLEGFGYNEVRAGGEVRWGFLPRTSAVLQGGWFSRAPNADTATDVSGIEVQTGLTGLVTAHVSATVKAGYADTLGSGPAAPGEDGGVRTWIGTFEGEWIATDSASVRAGYGHGLGIDAGPVVYTAHRVYGGGRILLAGRYGLRADAHWEQRSYGNYPAAVGVLVPASVSVLRVEPGIEAGISRWMSASLGYAFSKRTSDIPDASPLPGPPYSKYETWLRMQVRY